MTALRIANVLIWGLVLLYMIPGAWSAGFGKDHHRGDPMCLAGAINAFLWCGFSLRWFIVPDNEMIWMALYFLAFVNAIYIIVLARVYGRGARI